MKKILKYLLLLLPFLSEAQNFAIPTVTDLATARRNVIKGNASNYVLVMYRDTLRLLGATTMFNVGYSDASSIALRQFNITGGVGVNVSGGSGNLTADRNVTISLPQAVATTSSPSFAGINASGNITAGGNLTVTGTSNFNGNIIYSSSKYQQVQSYASSNNYQTFKWFIDGTGDASSLALETTRRSGSSISVRYPFLVHNGKVRINGLDTSLPTKDFEVLGDVSMQGTVYFPLSYQYPVNTFLKVGTNGELQGYDLNAVLDAKLNSSTAVSTYAALNSNNVFNGSNTFENPVLIKTTNAITGSYSKYVLSNTDFDYTNSGLMFNLSHYEGGAVSGTNVMLLRGNKLKIGNGLDPAYTLDVAGDGNISSNFTVGGTFSMPSPFNLGGTSVTTNATRLNYLSAASGTTGTTSSNLVYSNSPTLVTPNLGTPSAAILTNATGLPISTGVSGLGTGVATFLATPSSANLLAALTTKTGTGNAVFDTNPTITGLTASTITGGSGTTSTLTFKTTSGAGSTGANMSFNVGNNGANNAMTILNNANVGIGITTPYHSLQVGSGTFSAQINPAIQIVAANATDARIAAVSGNAKTTIIRNSSSYGEIFAYDYGTSVAQNILINQFGGNVLIGTTTDAGYKTDINGTLRATQYNLSALNTAPTSASATGTTGEIRVTSTHIYVCTATNTWVRAALSTW